MLNSERSFKMIVIGGGSFQGKSLLSSHIALHYSIPLVICTDTIRTFHHLLEPNNQTYFTSTYLMEPEILLNQMDKVSEMVKNILMFYEKRGENLIVEGMHLSPALLKDLATNPSVLIFCLNNELPFKQRLAYKALTRHKMEYYNSKDGKIYYGPLTKDNMAKTSYMDSKKRIEEIHNQIINTYRSIGLPVINYTNFGNALKKSKRLVDDFI